MRLRTKVTQLDLLDSSDDEDEEASIDDAWQPGSRDGSDGEDGGTVAVQGDAPMALESAPRRLSHADLALALQQLQAAHEAPTVLPPDALSQARFPSAGKP